MRHVGNAMHSAAAQAAMLAERLREGENQHLSKTSRQQTHTKHLGHGSIEQFGEQAGRLRRIVAE